MFRSVLAEQTQQTHALGAKVGNKIVELQEMVQAGNYQPAIDQAQNMLSWKNLTSYEIVQIYNFLAFVNYRAGNTDTAMKAYENLIAQGVAVPQGIMQSTLTTVSTLYVQQGKNYKALKYINQLFSIVASPGGRSLSITCVG